MPSATAGKRKREPSGIVRLGMTMAVVFVRGNGEESRQLHGRAPRAPSEALPHVGEAAVLENGKPSDATKRIRIRIWA